MTVMPSTFHYGIHQDDNFTLLRQSSIPLMAADPGRPVKIVWIDPEPFKQCSAWSGLDGFVRAWVLMNLKQHNPQLYEFTMKKLFSPTEGAAELPATAHGCLRLHGQHHLLYLLR